LEEIVGTGLAEQQGEVAFAAVSGEFKGRDAETALVPPPPEMATSSQVEEAVFVRVAITEAIVESEGTAERAPLGDPERLDVTQKPEQGREEELVVGGEQEPQPTASLEADSLPHGARASPGIRVGEPAPRQVEIGQPIESAFQVEGRPEPELTATESELGVGSVVPEPGQVEVEPAVEMSLPPNGTVLHEITSEDRSRAHDSIDAAQSPPPSEPLGGGDAVRSESGDNDEQFGKNSNGRSRLPYAPKEAETTKFLDVPTPPAEPASEESVTVSTPMATGQRSPRTDRSSGEGKPSEASLELIKIAGETRASEGESDAPRSSMPIEKLEVLKEAGLVSGAPHQIGPKGEDPDSLWEGYSERPKKPEAGPLAAPKEPTFITTTGLVNASGISPVQHSPRIRRRRPAIDATPYVGVASDLTLPNHYLEWNSLLEAHIRTTGGTEVPLVVSPRLLAATLLEFKGERVTPVDAEEDFKLAIQAAYRSCAMESPARLGTFRRFGPDGTPLCLGILAASVLAAYHMHSDEDASSGAYYVRLRDILGADAEITNMPRGFRTEEFERLWLFLAAWVEKEGIGSLSLPSGDSQRRYVEYPLVHVPLRQLDLEKLPRFFEWAAYSAGSCASPQRLEADLKRWSDIYQNQSFSQCGRAALTDARRVAAVAQAQSELKAWDGSVPQSQSSNTAWAQAELLLETAMRQIRLSILAHRPEGFPEVFQNEDEYLQGAELWYDPRELGCEDGPLLMEGFSWLDEHHRNRGIRRAAGTVFVLAPNSSYSGKVSRNQIPLHTDCSILCQESVESAVAEYLAEICGAPVRAISPGTIPRGWRLFLKVVAKRRPENVPEGLRALDVSTEVEIVPQGGLRIGPQMSWLLGGAPRLLVEGHNGQAVTVDGHDVVLLEDGTIVTNSLLESVGMHVVRVGAVERRISIVEPLLRYYGEFANRDCGPQRPVVVGPGDWILLGRDPREACAVRNAWNRESLSFCEFDPVWAVKVGAGRGATAVLLKGAVPEIEAPRTKSESQRWVSAIYEASIRRPEIVSAAPDLTAADAMEIWSQYSTRAKALKSRWKKTRR
jgi:hypothetical protein